jgi:hypothetical protein
MNRKYAVLLGTLVVTASSLAICSGCSSGRTNDQPMTAAPISLPSGPKASAAQPAPLASANNTRDLADAQQDTTLTAHASARDLDLGGGDSQGGGQLTDDALGALMRQIGGNPQQVQGGWILKVKFSTQDGINWTTPLIISLSKDQTAIWVAATVCQLSQNAPPPPQMLVNLLSANFAMTGVVFFDVSPQSTLLVQHRFMNAGVTPEVLKDNLLLFINSLKFSEPAYKPLMGAASGGGGGGGGGSPFQ